MNESMGQFLAEKQSPGRSAAANHQRPMIILKSYLWPAASSETKPLVVVVGAAAERSELATRE